MFTARCGLNLYIHIRFNIRHVEAFAMAQTVISGLLSLRSWVRSQVSPGVFCGAQSGTGSVFPHSTSVSPVNFTPPTLHTHNNLHVALIRRTSGRSLAAFQKWMLFRKSEAINLNVYSSFL